MCLVGREPLLNSLHFRYPTVQTVPCYVPSFWHNTGVWRTDGQTDRRTDGIAVANTALAMRALRALKKTDCCWWGGRPTWQLSGAGRTSLLLPPGAENPSYATDSRHDQHGWTSVLFARASWFR